MYRVIKATDELEDEEYVYEDWPFKTYSISGGYSGGNLDFDETDDPIEAIVAWFRISQKHRGTTSISCTTQEAALRLCEAGTPELLTKLWNRYKNPYKLEFLIDACEKQAQQGCRGFHDNRFGDMVFPFDVG